MSHLQEVRKLSDSQSFLCDTLRFTAALMVVFHHALYFCYPAEYAEFRRHFYTNLGSMGVAVFFCSADFS